MHARARVVDLAVACSIFFPRLRVAILEAGVGWLPYWRSASTSNTN